MSRREAPAMKLTVEDGRLVPASAWDQERLLTYRNRSTVNAYVTQDKPRWMERKYWAILDRVITTCGVKQRTAEDLHDHIKLKLGFVNAKFDDNGKLKVTLKSTKLMEDPEYEGYFNEAMGFLFDMTGVDPLTLKKESADVGEDESEPSDAPANPAMSDAGRDATPPSQLGVAATNSDGDLDAGNGAGAPEDSGSAEPDLVTAATPSSAPAANSVAQSNSVNQIPETVGSGQPASNSSELECIEKMMATAVDKTITPKEASEILAESADMWLGKFDDDRKPFVTSVFQTCKKVLRKELEAPAARRYLEGLAA